MQDDQQVSEDKLREALARLGAGSGKSANKPSRPVQQTPERRRRFVRDGQVVVEHQSTGRPMSGRMQAVRAAGGPEEHEEIERLRQSVKREQRRCEEVERHVGDLKGQLRTFETREAHTKLQILDLSKSLRDAQDQIQSLKSELHRAREDAVAASRRSPRPVGRPRKYPLPEQVSVRLTEPAARAVEQVPSKAQEAAEPVQWWKD
ncbi:hypothetical protein [Neokomagataea thailandica]|nr:MULTISPECIES: hypothetical protein [Neokomagataea]